MIIFIILIGLILRLISLNQSYWLDESIGVLEVKNGNATSILNTFLKVDNHPPLYYLTLEYWTKIGGYSEIWVRMLSILLGLGTIYFVYKISIKLTSNKKAAYLAATLLSVSQFFVYYTQEARMYALAAFFATVAIYIFMKLLDKHNYKNAKLWILFSFSLTCLLFTDYMPIFLWPVFPIIGIIIKTDKSWWKRFLIAHLPLIILGLLWLPTFTMQTKGGQWLLATLPSWKTVAGGASAKQLMLTWSKFVFGRISLFNKILYAILLLISSLPVLIAFYNLRRVCRRYLIIILWLVIPVVTGFIASFLFPAFIYFRFLYVFPAFCILIAMGLSQIRQNSIFVFLAFLFIFMQIVSLLIYYTDPNQQREQWRQSGEFIKQNSKTEDVILFEYSEPFTPYRLYYPDSANSFGATDSISANKNETLARTKELINNANRVYYFEYLADLSDPNRYVLQQLKNDGFILKQEYGQFAGVGKIILWERN